MYVKGMEEAACSPSGRRDAILAIDIGTTLLKCLLFDSRLELQKSAGVKLNIIKQKERYSEIDPVHLNTILREALDIILEQKNNYRIRCLGVSTQRNSFVLWNRHTGETYTKFILWNDTRPIDTCRSMNKSIKLNLFKMGAQVAAAVSTNQRIRQASKFKVEMLHVAPKLIEQLQILENKLGSDELKDVLYGTIDTWLIWNICKEKKFLSDVTCACCSGFYDIFYGEWSSLICSMFNIPKHILPQVTNNCYEFGTLKQDIVGVDYEIPMRSMIGDAQASFLAECAFTPGDCVITIGTGSFISVNIGTKAKCSKYDSYPLAGFFCDETQIYILHSPVCSAGVAIDWAKSVGLFDDYDQIESILQSTDSSDGVYFVPAFGLLEKSGTDDKSNIATGFIGLKQNTTKAQMLRSIFDSIAFSIKMRLEALFKDLDEHNVRLNSIRISGGVSRSSFLCQYLANLVNFEIEQSNFSYMSSGYGAAYAAALATKMFDRVTDLKNFRKVTQVYKPDMDQIRRTNGYKTEIAQWERTVERFVKWNDKYYH